MISVVPSTGPDWTPWIYAAASLMTIIGVLGGRARKLLRLIRSGGQATDLLSSNEMLRAENQDLVRRVEGLIKELTALRADVENMSRDRSGLVEAATQKAKVAELAEMIKSFHAELMAEVRVLRKGGP